MEVNGSVTPGMDGISGGRDNCGAADARPPQARRPKVRSVVII